MNAPIPASNSTASVNCTICLEDPDNKDPEGNPIPQGVTLAKTIECGHKFHQECIDKHLEGQVSRRKDAKCPNCNRVIIPLQPDASHSADQDAPRHRWLKVLAIIGMIILIVILIIPILLYLGVKALVKGVRHLAVSSRPHSEDSHRNARHARLVSFRT